MTRKKKTKVDYGKRRGTEHTPNFGKLPAGVEILRKARKESNMKTLSPDLVGVFNGYLRQQYSRLEADADDIDYFATRLNFPDYESLVQRYVESRWEINPEASEDLGQYISEFFKSRKQNGYVEE